MSEPEAPTPPADRNPYATPPTGHTPAQAPVSGWTPGPGPSSGWTPGPGPHTAPASGWTAPGAAPYPPSHQPPHQLPYGPQPWPVAEPPATPGTNGLAIAALVCGILPLVPLALVFGVIALGQIADRRQAGRWQAIVGMVAAGVWTAGLVLGGAPTAVLERDRDPVTWTTLEDGECVDGLSSLDPDARSRPSDLPEVPCSGPHEAEVYATFTLDDGPYPGELAVSRETDRRCRDSLGATPPDTVSGAVIGYIFLFPLEEWWPENRRVVCIAYDPQQVSVPGNPVPGNPGV